MSIVKHDMNAHVPHFGSGRRDPLVRMLVEDIGLAAPGMSMYALRELAKLRALGVEMDRETVLWVIEQSGRRVDEKEAKERAVAAERAKVSVVYYMRIGNRVKIGTTRDLKGRVATLMPEEVLVAEQGDAWLERCRHRQFAELRTTGEWFKLEGPLADHIEALRRAEDRSA